MNMTRILFVALALALPVSWNMAHATEEAAPAGSTETTKTTKKTKKTKKTDGAGDTTKTETDTKTETK